MIIFFCKAIGQLKAKNFKMQKAPKFSMKLYNSVIKLKEELLTIRIKRQAYKDYFKKKN